MQFSPDRGNCIPTRAIFCRIPVGAMDAAIAAMPALRNSDPWH